VEGSRSDVWPRPGPRIVEFTVSSSLATSPQVTPIGPPDLELGAGLHAKH
jgi:hypothetical protein